MFELIFLGWLAGFLISLVTGPLGSLIVWRRMSSFGDTLSHSSLLGFAISGVLKINSFFVMLCFISILSIILALLETFLPVSLETILSIVSYSSLSLGILFIHVMSDTKKINIHEYLFGDLLNVTRSDLFMISVMIIIILSILVYRWNAILSVIINEEIAQIDGINLFYTRLTVMLIIALTISIAIKFVGALLVTSLLVIPPATACRFSVSPESMVFIATIISIISVTGGILIAVFFNIPTSPSIVLVSSFICVLSHIKNINCYQKIL